MPAMWRFDMSDARGASTVEVNGELWGIGS